MLDSYPDRYAVGETYSEDVEAAARYCGPKALHSTFHFEFTNSPWSAVRFLGAIRRWQTALGEHGWPTYVLGNHDVSRPGSRYGKGEDDSRLKVAAAMQLTLRGTPFIYYGDEIGMRDRPPESKEQVLDPVGRRFWPFFKGRDGCRTPMQWDDGPQAGFSEGDPWLPLHPNYNDRNVAAQEKDPQSLYNFYRQLIQLRRQHPALRNGDFRPLDERPGHILAFQRTSRAESILVFLNFSAFERFYDLTDLDLKGAKLLLSSHSEQISKAGPDQLSLAPNEVLILKEE
jgi:alpha-glucosidase